MDEQITTKNCGVYINGEYIADIPKADAEIIANNCPVGTAEKLEGTLTLTMTNEQRERIQQTANRLGEIFAELSAAISRIMQEIADKLTPALQMMTHKINEIFPELAEYYRHQTELREVATPRQWHLYNYGRYRVRKKWEHALERRLRKGGKHEI